MKPKLSRRDFLKLGGATLVGAAGVGALTSEKASASPNKPKAHMQHSDELGPGVVGEVDHEKNRFNPTDILTDFDYGEVSTLPNGQTLREYKIVAANQNIEVVPGIEFPAWTYNGRIPGPTIRCTEGDRIRINFVNGSNHPHSMHFHGIHPAEMDGVPGTGPGGSVAPGEFIRLRVRRRAVRPASVSLSCFPAGAPYRQRSVRRVHRRSQRWPPAGRSRNGHGHAWSGYRL